MAGAMVAAGVITAGAGMMSAGKASDAAQSAQQQQLSAYMADLDFRKQIYGDYQKRAMPILDMLNGAVMNEDSLGYSQNESNIMNNTAAAQRSLEEQNARGGISAGSGIQSAQSQGLDLTRASQLSTAYAQGKLNKYQLAQALVQLNAEPLHNSGVVSGGYGEVGGAYGQMSNFYTGQAQQAAAGVQGGMQMIGYGMNQPGTSDPTSTDWTGGAGTLPPPVPTTVTGYPSAPPTPQVAPTGFSPDIQGPPGGAGAAPGASAPKFYNPEGTGA